MAKTIKGKFSKTIFQSSQIHSKTAFSSSAINIVAEGSVEETLISMSSIVETAFTYIERDAGRIEKLAITFDEYDRLMQKSVME